MNEIILLVSVIDFFFIFMKLDEETDTDLMDILDDKRAPFGISLVNTEVHSQLLIHIIKLMKYKLVNRCI